MNDEPYTVTPFTGPFTIRLTESDRENRFDYHRAEVVRVGQRLDLLVSGRALFVHDDRPFNSAPPRKHFPETP